MRVPALALAAALLLCGSAQAQEEVVYDEWVEVFQHGHKLSWSHEVVRRVDGPGRARFVRELEQWTPLREGAVARRSERATSDEAGRLLSVEGEQSGPQGEVSSQGRADGEAFLYQATIYGVEAERRFERPPHDVRVATLLAARALAAGEREEGQLSLRALRVRGEIDGQGYELAREGDLVRVAGEGQEAWYRGGDLVRLGADQRGRASGQGYHVATPAEARDPFRIDPGEVQGGGLEVEPLGLFLQVPGPGWRLIRQRDSRVALAHVSGVEVLVRELDIPIPVEEEARVRAASLLLGGLQGRSELGGLEFETPRADVLAGLPALTAVGRGDLDGVSVTMTLRLVGRPGKGGLVAAVVPGGMEAASAPLLAEVEAALDFQAGVGGSAGARSVRLPELRGRFRLPGGWSQDGPRAWSAADGQSSLLLAVCPLDPGEDPAAVLDAFAERVGHELYVEHPSARRRTASQRGREVRVVELRGVQETLQGMPVILHTTLLGFARGDELVVFVGTRNDLSLDAAAVDEALWSLVLQD